MATIKGGDSTARGFGHGSALLLWYLTFAMKSSTRFAGRRTFDVRVRRGQRLPQVDEYTYEVSAESLSVNSKVSITIDSAYAYSSTGVTRSKLQFAVAWFGH